MNSLPRYIAAAAFISLSAHAYDDDRQEMPDPLLQEVTTEVKPRYGDSNIVIQTQGKKEDGQITPDPLERVVGKKRQPAIVEKTIDIERIVTQEKKKKRKAHASFNKHSDELVTPDPLLGDMAE